jgi:hypothetical protein
MLSLGSRWRWVGSFTLKPLCPCGMAYGNHSTGGLVEPRLGGGGSVSMWQWREVFWSCWEWNFGCQTCNWLTMSTWIMWWFLCEINASLFVFKDQVELMWTIRNAYKILVWKPEGKRLLESRRCKWVDTIKMDFKEVDSDGVSRIHLT